MKPLIFNTFSKSLFLIMAAATMLFSCSSCATKAAFLNSSIVPAARGEVTVKKDKNNNYNIDVELSNLAESNRLQPPRKTYVVWMVSANNPTQNIGQIKSDTKFLSNKLRASFKASNAAKPTKIFITAEDDSSVQYPEMQIVLTTSDF